MGLQRLAWYARRLRAMSVAEVAHRARRTARHPLERARMRLGLYARLPPHLHEWRGPTEFYFSDAQRPLSNTTREYAENLLNGKRRVLGLGWIEVTTPPWHLEPSRGLYWPRLDATRVLGAAEGLDARLTWEINRGHEWVVLARAWAGTGDARFKTRLFEELGSWRAENALGVGINWASAMEAAIRIHSLCWVAAFLRGEPLDDIAQMLHVHTVFVRRNLARHSSANNHLIVELSALAVAERVLSGQPNVEALAELSSELGKQIFNDGVNAEMATHYHEFVLEALRLVAALERKYGAPCPHIEDIITRMQRFVDALTYRDGQLLHHGDNDGGQIIALLELDPEWLPAPREHATRSIVFQDSGLVVLRSARLVASFDVGPFGFGSLAAHAHCDALAVHAAVDGEPVLVDRGTCRYNGDPSTREYFRSTAAHNTLQVGTREQATAGGPFLWTKTPHVRLIETRLADERDVAVGEHDGFGDVIHRRRVVRHHDVLVIRDEISARAEVSIRYHLAPSVDIGHERAFALLTFYGTGTVNVVTTRHSDQYGSACTAKTLEVHAHLEAGEYVVAVLSPRNHNDQAVVSEIGRAPRLATFELVRSAATAPQADSNVVLLHSYRRG